MHIVKDENGNVMSHSYHEHAHTHTCEHTHEHSHMDGQADGHNHNHDHESHGECSENGSRNSVLLKYMYEHNSHHMSELSELEAKMRADGCDSVAEEIRKAVEEFKKGNEHLASALGMTSKI